MFSRQRLREKTERYYWFFIRFFLVLKKMNRNIFHIMMSGVYPVAHRRILRSFAVHAVLFTVATTTTTTTPVGV